MSQSELPGSTTSLPSSTTHISGNETGRGNLLWIPYVTLTFILTVLACASFIHYHFKNREKYIEAMYKRKNNIHLCPRKYRVTLNRKGIVHMGGVEIDRCHGLRNDLEKSSTTTAIQSMKHDIFIVSKAVSKKNDNTSGKKLDAVKSKTNQSYDNEAYDQDSSQGSEKSLIRRSSDHCVQLEHEPFTAKDVQVQHREQLYAVDKQNGKSNPRPSSRTDTPLDIHSGADTPTGLVFRSETPLNLPDNSDHTRKKIVLHKRGSRSSLGVKHATVAPLREETDNEVIENIDDDEFADEDIDVI